MQELLKQPGVNTVIGHMCRQGMKLQAPDGEVRPVRKPTRWASSASEVLKRLGLRCTNETCGPGDPRWHPHTALEGRLPGGQLRTQAAAHYPPALCANILRGVASQYAREGKPVPQVVQKRLGEGRAVCDLSEAHSGRRLVWADDYASLYAALPDGLMDIKTYVYDAGGSEIARRTSR